MSDFRSFCVSSAKARISLLEFEKLDTLLHKDADAMHDLHLVRSKHGGGMCDVWLSSKPGANPSPDALPVPFCRRWALLAHTEARDLRCIYTPVNDTQTLEPTDLGMYIYRITAKGVRQIQHR